MGRAGVLPTALDRVNGRGAPAAASILTSIITIIVIALFVITDQDPIGSLFYWSSGVAVLAIVIVEILVSIAVIAYFRREKDGAKVWNTLIAPLIAIVALAIGAYLLMAKFALLAGTVAEGRDPVAESFALNGTGWFLVLLPFIAFAVGIVVGLIRRNTENEDAIADLVS
jgi:amino acid transporter